MGDAPQKGDPNYDPQGNYPPQQPIHGQTGDPAAQGYPPQQGYLPHQGGQQAYPPHGQAAYPPHGQAAYPPHGQAAYPPHGQAAYPPHGQGYPPQQGYYPQAVVVHAPMAWSQRPQVATCPNCGHQGMTNVRKEVGTGTHVMAGVLCFFTGCCCWIPYVIDDAKDTIHQCSNCNQIIGEKRVMS